MNWRQLKDRGLKEARGEMVIFFLAGRVIGLCQERALFSHQRLENRIASGKYSDAVNVMSRASRVALRHPNGARCGRLPRM
jgi:hypothetical protein